MDQKIMKGLFITGTDTGVGKTVVAGAIAAYLRSKGKSVGVMKPVETGCRENGDGLVPSDATFLKKASGSTDILGAICPYCFAEPLAPAVAAQRAGKTIDPKFIRKVYRAIARGCETVIVEGAGGLMVPINGKYTYLDLAAELGLPVVIVGRAGLGTLNHTLLTLEAARSRGLDISGIILNHDRRGNSGLAEKTNPEVLRELAGAERVYTLKYAPSVKGSQKALAGLGGELSRQGFFGLTKK